MNGKLCLEVVNGFIFVELEVLLDGPILWAKECILLLFAKF